MIILIKFTKPITITALSTRDNLDNYDAISLTAGNFTANPNNFNFLPYGLTNDKTLKEQYKSFFDRVNTTQEVGVMNQFHSPTYFLVPKTKGENPIDLILSDLFEAIKRLNKKNLLMTHWMYLNSNYPETEIRSLISFLKTKHDGTNLEKLYIDIDDRYHERLYNDLITLKETN